jgi:hypothetical protein
LVCLIRAIINTKEDGLMRLRAAWLLYTGPNPPPFWGKRQRGTVIYERRNSVSVVEHCSSGTVYEDYSKSVFMVHAMYCSYDTVVINLHHSFLIKWLRERREGRGTVPLYLSPQS